MIRLAPVPALLAALTLAACSDPKDIKVKQNPQPKMRYEITLTVDHAPGQIESVTSYTQYSVTDKRCAPAQAISGAPIYPPDQNVPFAVTPNADGTWTGAVYLDQLQDEDYYGKGICRWSLQLVGIQFKIGGATFGTFIPVKEIIAQQPWITYVPNTPDSTGYSSGIPATGNPRPEWFAERTPKQFFTTTLAAREDFQ
ncbi:MAG: hypothetical protein LBE24_07000 [Methylobacillus sp.]|jgi:hypothetical protein|nr:hypothetical protein [Methylobacillus sp.]